MTPLPLLSLPLFAELKKHNRIKGIISGFDRILFRGTLRSISYSQGIERWLWYQGVRLTEFALFAEKVSARLKENAQDIAAKAGRPFQHILSPKASKEDIARSIMGRDGIRKGLICVLSCVEPCRSFMIQKDRRAKILKLVSGQRQCLHLYFYYADREFGLMHVRLQTWLPFNLQVCLNGWEYLARRLDRLSVGYEKRDNCFARIDDLPRARRIMDSLLDRRWVRWFDLIARRVNPWLDSRNGLSLRGYYWTIRQGEYSTDVLFKDTQSLEEVFPDLLRHAVAHFSSKDVLRFLQRRVLSTFNGEIKSEMKHRIEGVRIKHMVEENSIKMYDKQGCVLRIETTINNPRYWSVWRRATRKGKQVMTWVPMRKGIGDIRRRAELSRATNERYLQALSVVGETLPSHKLLDPVSRRRIRDGRSYRALRPISPEDAELLRLVSDGQFILHGFRNRDLRVKLNLAGEKDQQTRRRNCARIGRTIRLLRAHGLVAKISRSHRYRVTAKGHQVIATAIRLRETNALAFAA
jgi:hypothetical protein